MQLELGHLLLEVVVKKPVGWLDFSAGNLSGSPG